MDQQALLHARDVAIQAAKLAGEMARSRLRDKFDIQLKDESGDLVTEIDLAADQAIVDMIMKAFPHHLIYSEEAGESGEHSPYVWHIDPLDGTNNFAIGMPLFGVSISLSYQQETILGVVHDSYMQETYWAIKGQGAWLNEYAVVNRPVPQLLKSTLSWIQGHVVSKSDETALRLRQSLESSFKRVLRLWAPSLTWVMLARGDLGGIVLYRSEGQDLYAGVRIAMEAGVRVTDHHGMLIDRWDREIPCLVAAHPDHHEQLLSIVRAVLTTTEED
ncbi:inositol monophosphatase [Paenibacillus albiflavus]|uniref:Inositol monophosphatase n=2 Tax=Paenibacillus albiflavus TaxID=2545760 RepID=A0A4R4EFJ2_9BACL|nr:inositol monophosphatase [Paenibacillus albiflavus]